MKTGISFFLKSSRCLALVVPSSGGQNKPSFVSQAEKKGIRGRKRGCPLQLEKTATPHTTPEAHAQRARRRELFAQRARTSKKRFVGVLLYSTLTPLQESSEGSDWKKTIQPAFFLVKSPFAFERRGPKKERKADEVTSHPRGPKGHPVVSSPSSVQAEDCRDNITTRWRVLSRRCVIRDKNQPPQRS